LRTAISLSEKYCERNNLSQDDAVQSAIIGIINAIENFDLKKYKVIDKKSGGLFSYYCHRSILMELSDFYRQNIRQFSVSDYTNTQLQKINNLYKNGKLSKFLTDGLDKNHQQELVNFIKAELNINKDEKVIGLLNLFKSPMELDKNIDDENSSSEKSTTTIKDVVLKTDRENDINFVNENEKKYIYLSELIEELPEEDKKLIKSKYGIDCEKKKIKDLSKLYKIGVPTISSRILKIEEKLKDSMKSKI